MTQHELTSQGLKSLTSRAIYEHALLLHLDDGAGLNRSRNVLHAEVAWIRTSVGLTKIRGDTPTFTCCTKNKRTHRLLTCEALCIIPATKSALVIVIEITHAPCSPSDNAEVGRTAEVHPSNWQTSSHPLVHYSPDRHQSCFQKRLIPLGRGQSKR